MDYIWHAGGFTLVLNDWLNFFKNPFRPAFHFNGIIFNDKL